MGLAVRFRSHIYKDQVNSTFTRTYVYIYKDVCRHIYVHTHTVDGAWQ